MQANDAVHTSRVHWTRLDIARMATVRDGGPPLADGSKLWRQCTDGIGRKDAAIDRRSKLSRTIKLWPHKMQTVCNCQTHSGHALACAPCAVHFVRGAICSSAKPTFALWLQPTMASKDARRDLDDERRRTANEQTHTMLPMSGAVNKTKRRPRPNAVGTVRTAARKQCEEGKQRGAQLGMVVRG